MDWNDLRFLLALYRHRSHARAARALGVDATTVGRKLAALEAAVGARLVRRVAGGHALTATGERLVPALERIELDAAAIERLAQGSERRAAGVVRLTAGDGLTNYVLVPALPLLRARHPDLTVQLVGEHRVLDLGRREADVGLRLVRPRGANLVAQPLPPLALGVYASPAYLRDRGTPRSLRDSDAHAWLDYGDLPRQPELDRLRRRLERARVVLRATATSTLVEACAAGLGLAILYARIGDGDARLVRVLPQVKLPARDAWVVYHEDERASARVRAVVDWVKEQFR